MQNWKKRIISNKKELKIAPATALRKESLLAMPSTVRFADSHAVTPFRLTESLINRSSQARLHITHSMPVLAERNSKLILKSAHVNRME